MCMGSPPGVYGSRRRHMANPIANMLPIVYCTTCTNVFVITRNIMEARTQGGGTCVAMEGPGAESGPWGAISET